MNTVPGFIDLHVWGEPAALSRLLPRSGTTAFCSALGPQPVEALQQAVARVPRRGELAGARWLGWHLEGPFLNPRRGGALPRRWMRAPRRSELEALWRASRQAIRLITLAPELPGALDAIRWCRRRGIAVSLGHTEAGALAARRAIAAGARAVTHVFNGMPPLHHRRPGLLDVALASRELVTMAIADGVHVSPAALRLLVQLKGASRVALVTDSIRHAHPSARPSASLGTSPRGVAGLRWPVVKRHGAFYLRDGTLAGSDLTMIHAVRMMVERVGVPLRDAVRMASAVPARLLGAPRTADRVTFDERFRVLRTIVAGRAVYER